MAKVYYIPIKQNIYDSSRNVELLSAAFDQYNENDQRVTEETKQSRFRACAECEYLSYRMNCSRIGSCTSGRRDFFKMHLNRERGGCPAGRW